ncbi:MAG TPA: 50S ribosomal protein L3 [Alphaproteobacteria bacterium]|nr:50S ribosomal protein L3 [Alphaproteobacteria bacterium]
MAQALAKTRTGVIAKKLGMTRLFDDSGSHVPVTAFKLENNQVIAQRTSEKEGYTAVQVGAGVRKASRTTAAQRGHFAKSKVEPKQKVLEFRVPAENMLEVGAEITASHFVVGQFVDVTATTVGRGFAGAMKRWNFGGLPASHGVSAKAHRSLGGTGGRQDPGKTFKNKKMHGHMGDKVRTQMNLKVIAIDEANDVVFVKGCVPGSENAWVTIRDAVKKMNKMPSDLPFPAGLKQTNKPQKEEAAPAPAPVEDTTAVTEAPAEAPAAEASEGEQS